MTFDEKIHRLQPEDYEKQIRVILYNIYKSLPFTGKGNLKSSIYHRVEEKPDEEANLWGKTAVIPLNLFQDEEKAITVIKDWLSRGAIAMAHFNKKYTHLIIYRDQSTEAHLKNLSQTKKAA
jgi:hypothetical protein